MSNIVRWRSIWYESNKFNMASFARGIRLDNEFSLSTQYLKNCIDLNNEFNVLGNTYKIDRISGRHYVLCRKYYV